MEYLLTVMTFRAAYKHKLKTLKKLVTEISLYEFDLKIFVF